jgi:hypothetical protein
MVNSQGREPLDRENSADSPEGAAEVPSRAHCRPFGAPSPVRACSQGLAPLAIDFRPCGADAYLLESRKAI